MTSVAFHFNAPDKTTYTCRLLRKAAGSGARVIVTGDPEELDRLDVALWTFSALEFVPHCRGDAPASMVQASPVVLAGSNGQVPQAAVLVHLGGPPPDGIERFEKVIEVVGQDVPDRQEARQRWKFYAGLGHELVHHDVMQRGRVNS